MYQTALDMYGVKGGVPRLTKRGHGYIQKVSVLSAEVLRVAQINGLAPIVDHTNNNKNT